MLCSQSMSGGNRLELLGTDERTRVQLMQPPIVDTGIVAKHINSRLHGTLVDFSLLKPNLVKRERL
jgi:hypothetical protein